MIVNVYYVDEKTGFVRRNRAYSYRCSIESPAVGMRVIAPTSEREALAEICEIDVPESKVSPNVLPLLKEITKEAPTNGE